MRAGIENFPLRPDREVRHGLEKERRKGREKGHPHSQRVIIVCFEMGVPYFKVRWGTRSRARGLWGSSCLALRLGKEVREREDRRERDFTRPCNQRMQCGPVCGCQSSKASGESRLGACLGF